jgi:hypothetical protein
MSTRDLLGRALGRGAQWRYLALFVLCMLLPAALSFLPVSHYLGWLFDHSPREADLVPRLDSPAFTEVVKQLGESEAAAIVPGVGAALLVSVVFAPALAGAAVALARTRKEDAPLRISELLRGAGELYPRMVRMAFVACLPLGVAAGGAGLAFHMARKAGERAVAETAADRATLLATAASLVLVWLAHLTVEAGRAAFAAQPARKSAFLAWWCGVRFLVRHPLKVVILGSVTTLVGVGGALLVTAARTRTGVHGPAGIVAVLVLGQLAVAAIAWGRSSRLVGLVELFREEIPWT